MDIFRRKKFDEAMFAKDRTLAIRVGRYQSSDIKEAHFDYGYIKGDAYKPGGTCAGSGKITFTSIITTFNKLDKVYPEIGLLVDGTYEWVKMGEYFINDIEIDRNRNTTKLDLMDGMFKLNREHVTDLTYPAEVRHVIKEICLKTGVKLANENMDLTSMNYVIDNIPKDKKMTFRDVLSLATQMLGMSCFFNREGKLEIKELTDSGITITADSYFMHGLTKSEVEYQIAGITCKKDKETLTVGLRTGRSLELDNRFMSQVVLDNLYHKIKDIRYYPFNLNYQGHLLLNVGEWVTIKTNTGETFKSPILSQSFTFKGGLRARISADSKAGNDAQYLYAGTITKKIVQFSESEARIQNQIEEADKGFDQKVDKIKKDFSDQVELAKAKTEEVKRQLSDTINQRFSNFNNGPLQEAKRKADEALRNVGASSLLAQEAKQISERARADIATLRQNISNDYVAKSTYQEDARGLERRFSTITTQTNNYIATKIAQYKQTVDGQFASITSQIAGKANLLDFQRVQETSQLYERIIGRSESDIAEKVARMALTNQLFQVEVGKYSVSGPNLIKNSDFKNGTNEWSSTQNLGRLVKHGFYRNGQKDLMRLSNATKSENYLYSHRFDLERNTDYVLNFRGFNNSALVSYDVFILGRRTGESNGFTIIKQVVSSKKLSTARCEDVSVTFNSGEMDNAFIRFDNNGSSSGTADLYITEIDLYKGYKPRPWQPAPEDAVADANAKLEATQTKMTQLAGSWSVQNINSAGDLISGLNLGANGHNRLDGKLTHITGETLIDKAVIKSAMVDKLKTANFEAGSVTTVVLDAEAVTAEKIKVDQALFNKLVANEAYLSQLFAKQAFINRVQSVAIDASQVRSGILSGDRIYGGTIRGANIFGGTLTGHTKIQLGSYGSFDTVNGGLQINVPRDYNAKDGLGVQFIGSYGRGENVPYGLFIYKDSDFTTGGYASRSDDFLLTVEGYIKANGIGWFKTGKGSINGSSTATIGYWNSSVSMDFGGSGNDIYYSYNGKAYSLWSIVNQHFSDRRLKENIVDCKHKALDYIHQFQFKEYDWKKQEDRQQQAHTKIGLIAQEVQAVDPTLVYENGDTLNLDNLRLTNIALKAIQELALENKTLTHRLENLENERRTA